MPNKKIQPVMIGVFVILSIVLFMTAIVIFGGNKFFAKENTLITYFEGSLDGLSVGAAVTYRGVTIGKVKAINIQIQADSQKDQAIIIPVHISLNTESSLIVDGSKTKSKEELNNFLKEMCTQGLRAKLKLKSVVTGKRYIDLAFYENSRAVYRDKKGKYLEIPTLPSEMQQFSKMIENINLGELYSKFIASLDSLEKLTTELTQTLDKDKTTQLLDELLAASTSLNSILEKVDTSVPPILHKVNSGLDQFTNLTDNADKMLIAMNQQIQPLSTNLKSTFANMNSTLAHVDTLLSQAKKTITPNSPLYYQFTQTMRQLEKSAKSIEDLSNFIHRNPDTLIFGLQKSGKAEHNK